MSDQFKALIINQEGDNFTREVKSIDKSFLKHGDVTVKVDYSDLNFKDGMILKNGGRLVKEFPHIPGIDFSGTVIESENSKFKEGDEVIIASTTLKVAVKSELLKAESDRLMPVEQNQVVEVEEVVEVTNNFEGGTNVNLDFGAGSSPAPENKSLFTKEALKDPQKRKKILKTKLRKKFIEYNIIFLKIEKCKIKNHKQCQVLEDCRKIQNKFKKMKRCHKMNKIKL